MSSTGVYKVYIPLPREKIFAISGSRRGVDDAFTLLGCYAEEVGSHDIALLIQILCQLR